MKIIPINNYRNYHISTLIKHSKPNNITFGHYLDDEKERKESRLSSLESALSRVESRIWSENWDFDREYSSLDSQIDSAEDKLDEIERRADKLRDRADSKEYYNDSLASEGYSLQQKAKKNLSTIKELEAEKQSILEQLQAANTSMLNDEFSIQSKKIEAEFKGKAEKAQNSVKGSLIRKVINPIIESSEGKEVILPSSIYIENLTAAKNIKSDTVAQHSKTDINTRKIEFIRNNILKLAAGTEFEPIIKDMKSEDLKVLFDMLSEGKQVKEQSQFNILRNFLQQFIFKSHKIKTEVTLPDSQADIDSLTKTAEPVFSWLVKQTDSNYAKINAAEYTNKEEAISLLKKISLLAFRSYEETGRRTFTLISGFESLISSIKDNEGVKDLFLNAEKMYHNMIIVISKVPYAVISKNIRFSDVINVENSFFSDKRLGKDSLIEFVSKHQYTGENLLSKVIKK